MTTDELMQPRYKVIADYPGNRFKLGEIFYVDNETAISKDMNVTLTSNLKQFPNIFTELSWWEERKVEDMPEYLKQDDDKVYKVRAWITNIEKFRFEIFNYPRCYNEWEYFGKGAIGNFLPATEQEYNEYQSSKQKA